MPYKVYEENGEYCVHKIADDGGKGEKVACHGADKDKAAAQVRALYAKENQAVFSNTILLHSNQFKHVNKNGKDFLVVSGVPAREQVMNTYLVPAHDLMRSLKGWNGVPITIQHPKLNDRSANVPDPDVAVIGRFYNAVWDADNNRMVGEYWIETEEAGKYVEGQAILARINEGLPLETSTGYYADDEQTAGEHAGKAYKTIHRNLLPDHIAILTNEVGACSLQDGCGVNRNVAVTNCECDCAYHNEASFDQTISALRQSFDETFNPSAERQAVMFASWVREVYPTYLIVEADGKLYKVGYEKTESGMTFTPREGWKQVEMQYVEVEAQSTINHSRDADPVLIPPQKETTMKFDELQALLAKKGIAVTVNGDDITVEGELETPAVEGLSADDVAALKTLAGLKLNQKALDGINQLPALIEMAHNVEAGRKAEKENLVAIMFSNAANVLSKDELEAMPLPVLQKLHAVNSVTYAPIGGARETLFGNEDVLVSPSVWSQVKPEADNG